MAIFSCAGARLDAIAAAVPKQRVSNRDLSLIAAAERDFLIKTTGVEEKRIAPDHITTADLCFAAADQLLTQQQASRDSIELLVFVSQSNDYFLPATAATLQHRLGFGKHCMAFDVGLGCSGYVYGLTIINSLMQACGLQHALLLAGDISSTTCSPDDKSTYPLFGDAGTATLLSLPASSNLWHGNLLTDGAGSDAIIVPSGMQRNKPNAAAFVMQDIAPGIRRSPMHLALKGEEIFAFSLREVPSSVETLLQHSGQSKDSIDYFVMHQANRLMNETIRKKLKFAPEQVPYSIDQFGNTSSASIPLTLVTRLAEQLKTPLRLLLSGFGVGLSWGNLLIEADSIHCLPLIEVD